MIRRLRVVLIAGTISKLPASIGAPKAKGADRRYIAYQRVAKSAANVHAEMFSRQAHTYNA